MLTESAGGPGTQFDWVQVPVAPQSTLSNAYTFTNPFFIGDAEQLAFMVRITSNAAATALMRVRWVVDLSQSAVDEYVEVVGAAIAGPPPVQQYTLSIKEWGPLPSGSVANDGARYTIYRPVDAHFVKVGIKWSGAPAATDQATVWLERQRGAQLQNQGF